ncbi:hypothetical protein Tco_1114743, partial [Tanacetum coccineum]
MTLSGSKECDIRKPIRYLNSGCSRHMIGVKSYLYKYVEQPGPKVVFGDDSTCTFEGYGSIKYNGIVFTKLAFVNGLKYNLISINQLCDAKYIVQFDEKRGTIFNSNKEVVMIAPKVRYVYVLDMTSSAEESCFFAKAPYEIFRKFDEKPDDGYFLGYSLVSKAFKVFNTRRQQTEETYHITFDENPNAIKFTKPL